jgi:hypothetical protein
MTLETMKELFGIAHFRDDEDEVPNMKCMRVVEDVLLSQPVTTAVPPGLHRFQLEEEFLSGPPITVPPEEEEVLVPQGPSIMVPLEKDVPPEEEEFPALAVTVPQRPTVAVLLEEEEVPAAP